MGQGGKSKKDRWDKAQIIGGLFGVAVALFAAIATGFIAPWKAHYWETQPPLISAPGIQSPKLSVSNPPSTIPADDETIQKAGPDVKCPDENALTVAERFSSSAIASAPSFRTRGSVSLTDTKGGNVIGTLSANADVRIVCAINRDFAIIKEAEGIHEGVVERAALYATD